MANEIIAIDNTKFMWFRDCVNFSGDPERDRNGDIRRKAVIQIPDEAQALALREAGFNIGVTTPRENDDPATYIPTYYTTVILKYRDRMGNMLKWLPKVVLIPDEESAGIELTEETVGQIDFIRAKRVRLMLNPHDWQKGGNSGRNLYVRTMYVEQDNRNDPYDPYGSEYKNRALPFD